MGVAYRLRFSSVYYDTREWAWIDLDHAPTSCVVVVVLALVKIALLENGEYVRLCVCVC